MNIKRGIVTMSAAAALLGLAGCGSSGTGSSTPAAPSATAAPSASAAPTSPAASGKASSSASSPTASAQPVLITIKSFAYQGPKDVKPGAKITVKNEDSVAHTVTADKGGAFNVKVDPGSSATFTAPGKAGTYDYHCTFHANMHGILTVKQ